MASLGLNPVNAVFLKKNTLMVEVTIRTENEVALQKLLEFISTIGFEVVGQKRTANGEAAHTEEKEAPPEPPIEWAEEPDVTALAGVWKDNPITLEELRKLAWGIDYEKSSLRYQRIYPALQKRCRYRCGDDQNRQRKRAPSVCCSYGAFQGHVQ